MQRAARHAGLNEELQRLVQRKYFGVETPPRPANRRPPLLKTDKVIQTRNNYDLGVMNGSIGFVKDIYANGMLVIEFDGRTVEVEKCKGSAGGAEKRQGVEARWRGDTENGRNARRAFRPKRFFDKNRTCR